MQAAAAAIQFFHCLVPSRTTWFFSRLTRKGDMQIRMHGAAIRQLELRSTLEYINVKLHKHRLNLIARYLHRSHILLYAR